MASSYDDPRNVWGMQTPASPIGANQDYTGMNQWGMPTQGSPLMGTGIDNSMNPSLLDINDPAQWGLDYSIGGGAGLGNASNSGGGFNLDFGGMKLGEGLTAAANVFGAWNGYQKNKLAKQQMEFTQSNFREQFDYSKQLTEERRNRHNSLRAKYS